MKKLIVRILIGVVALVLVALVVIFFSLNSIVKKGVETVGPKLTKVDVRLGSAKLSPFSGSGQLTKLFVGNPEGYKTPSAIQVGDVKMGVEVGSLFSNTLAVDEVNIQAVSPVSILGAGAAAGAAAAGAAAAASGAGAGAAAEAGASAAGVGAG